MTEKPGVLQSMGSQRVADDWVTEQQQQQLLFLKFYIILWYPVVEVLWGTLVYGLEITELRVQK